MEANVRLSLYELNKDVIARYVKNAKRKGFDKINFVFGEVTKVKFTIIIKNETKENS